MAHMAGVLPCRNKGSPGRTGQEDKARGQRRGLACYGTEQVECIELSLGIDDVCKNPEHPGAKGEQGKLADVKGGPLQAPEQSIPMSDKLGKNARMDTKTHTQK